MSDTEPAATQEVSLEIAGMTCASCVGRVQKALSRVPGVEDATVNLATERAYVRVAPGVSALRLTAAVEEAGYLAAETAEEGTARSAVASGTDADPHARAHRRDTVRVFSGALLAGIVMVLSMLPGPAPAWRTWTVALLASWVTFGVGAEIHAAAWRGVRHGHVAMDGLVSLGSLSAWVLSVWAWTSGPHAAHGGAMHGSWFESAATIVAFVRLGRWLEHRARRRAADSLRVAAGMLPDTAPVQRDGREVLLPVDEIRVGDRVRVAPHARVPVDGVVRVGNANVDESLLTGESVPVARAPGDPLVAGATNGESSLVIEATAVGRDTRLARIAALVERAQAARPPIQQLVDRVAAVFVPSVIVLALAVGFHAWWGLALSPSSAWMRAVTVLVIACPCALGLATPVAVVAATGTAARMGLLVRDPAVFEVLRRVTDVVFDKTGTLTAGRPALDARAVHDERFPVRSVLKWAAALERESRHPIARALVASVTDDPSTLPAASGVTSTPGHGIRGIVEGHAVEVCRASVDADAGDDTSAVDVHVDGVRTLTLTFRDALRTDARGTLDGLRADGVVVHVASGDREGAVRAVAAQLDVSDWRAGCTPEDKAAWVRALRAGGRVVAMVGDGVNDAPALAVADVGLGVSGGADLALAASPIVLLRGGPSQFVDARRLADRTVRIIRQNLAWASIYNLLALPLALSGALERFGGPMVGSAAMAMSSLTVVGNALRLARTVSGDR